MSPNLFHADEVFGFFYVRLSYNVLSLAFVENSVLLGEKALSRNVGLIIGPNWVIHYIDKSELIVRWSWYIKNDLFALNLEKPRCKHFLWHLKTIKLEVISLIQSITENCFYDWY